MWPQVKYKQKWCETTSSERIDACQDLLWSFITWIFTISGRNTSSSETVKPSLVTIVQECGPSWICQNTSMEIMYGNIIVLYSYIVMLWGKKEKPFLPFHSNLWTSWLMALHVFSSGASATHQSSDSLGSCQAGPSPPRRIDGTLVLESWKVETI